MAENSGAQPSHTRATATTAGGRLAAADALNSGQQTYTRAQVAYLMAIAYDAGRTATYREDLAELHSVWEDKAERRATYEDRIAARIAEYAEAGRKLAARLGRPDGYQYTGGPVDWNTGRPMARRTHLAAVA